MKHKKWLIIPLCVVFTLFLIVVGYVIYVFAAYDRLPDMLTLSVENNRSETAKTDTEYTAISFNIGFGAYEPDYGFFMDGGTESWAFSRERLEHNMAAIADFLATQQIDICLLQEVDENGTRTYHFNERQFLTDQMNDYAAIWAQNWNSPFLFYPFLQPHGKNIAGQMTFSVFQVTSAIRRSLSIEDTLKKLVDLDRCYSVSRMPVENGRELIVYNVHLSAYTTDGTIAEDQLQMLIADMKAEYESGNYVICGGDFNKDLLGNSDAIFGVDGDDYTWAQPFPERFLEGTGLRLLAPLDDQSPVPSCRNADGPYYDGQYVVTVDGFIVSDNVVVKELFVCHTGFAYSDHNPVQMRFVLQPVA